MNVDKLISMLLSVVIIAVCFVGAKCTSDYKQEIERLKDNQKELTSKDTVTSVVAKDKKELEQLIGEQGKKALEEINVKPSKVVRVTELVTETVFDTVVLVKEKIVHDTIVQCVSFVDPYLSFGGEIKDGKFNFELSTRDSLTIVAHKQKKKFLFIPYYSRKKIDIDIVNSSPYNKIVYGRLVTVQ